MPRGLALYLWVAAGSGVGSAARYGCGIGLRALLPGFAPAGTLAVNVLGSFVICLFAGLTGSDGRILVRPGPRQFVMAGFCGGFTTFSAFSLETFQLILTGHRIPAIGYLVVSIFSWLFAGWLGFAAAMRLNR